MSSRPGAQSVLLHEGNDGKIMNSRRFLFDFMTQDAFSRNYGYFDFSFSNARTINIYIPELYSVSNYFHFLPHIYLLNHERDT